jgi:hypothetical protein
MDSHTRLWLDYLVPESEILLIISCSQMLVYQALLLHPNIYYTVLYPPKIGMNGMGFLAFNLSKSKQ